MPINLAVYDQGRVSGQKSEAVLEQVPQESVWLANYPSHNTRKTYKRSVADMIAFLNISSSEELYGVGLSDVIMWREHLTAQGMKPRTIAGKMSAVSEMYKFLMEHRLTDINPVMGLKRPKVNSQEVETVAMTKRQVRAMLDAPDTSTVLGLRDRAILHIYFYTGCRLSEPTRLKVRDFFEDQGYWCLRFTVKGAKINRVAIHPELKATLDDYLSWVDHGDDMDEYLFREYRAKESKPMSRQAMGQLFKKYGNMAGVPALVTPHSARATFITEALDKDHPLEAVQRTVGHSCSTTTLSYDKRGNNPRTSASFVVSY